jgi:hypothetical protein
VGYNRRFSALYRGKCAGCGTPFEEGTRVYFPDGTRDVTVDACCPEAPEPEAIDGEDNILTMPRGKTAKDRCDVCFQIKSSNNTCWC